MPDEVVCEGIITYSGSYVQHCLGCGSWSLIMYFSDTTRNYPRDVVNCSRCRKGESDAG